MSGGKESERAAFLRFFCWGGRDVGARKRVEERVVNEPSVDREAKGQRGEANPRKRPLSPARCKGFAQRRMAEALPEIVDRFLREAKLGSIAHAKALASLSGLDRMEVPVRGTRGKRRGPTLTEVLMQDLQRGRERAGSPSEP